MLSGWLSEFTIASTGDLYFVRNKNKMSIKANGVDFPINVALGIVMIVRLNGNWQHQSMAIANLWVLYHLLLTFCVPGLSTALNAIGALETVYRWVSWTLELIYYWIISSWHFCIQLQAWPSVTPLSLKDLCYKLIF